MKKRIIAIAFISIMVLATLSNTVFAKQSEVSFKENIQNSIKSIVLKIDNNFFEELIKLILNIILFPFKPIGLFFDLSVITMIAIKMVIIDLITFPDGLVFHLIDIIYWYIAWLLLIFANFVGCTPLEFFSYSINIFKKYFTLMNLSINGE